jgi:hypothetical protein
MSPGGSPEFAGFARFSTGQAEEGLAKFGSWGGKNQNKRRRKCSEAGRFSIEWCLRIKTH